MVALAWRAPPGACLNGFLVAKAKIPPFIVTLGTLGMSLGAALLITGGVDEREVPFKLVDTIGSGRLFAQVPYLVIIAFAVALVFGIVARRDAVRPLHVRDRVQRGGRAPRRHQRRPPPDQGLHARRDAVRARRLPVLARFATTTIGGHDTDNLTRSPPS